MRRVKRILLTCLLLAACSSDPEPRTAAPAPAPSPAPASASPSPAAAGLTVAVTRTSGGLELYRLDPRTRTAVLDRVLAPPQEGARALRVAAVPTRTCATWHLGTGEVYEDPRTTLVCYPAGSSQGQAVSGVDEPLDVALSDDGTRLAWAQVSPGENQLLGVGQLSAQAALTGERRLLSRAGQPATGGRAFTGTAVQSLAWADDGSLLVSTLVESDDGPDLLRVDVASPRTRGWLDDGVPVEVPDEDYLTYDSVVSVAGGTALAVERGSYLDEQAPPSRAVRVEVASGRVIDLVATAADGRALRGVSGSAEAVLYTTGRDDGSDVKHYLRRAGEQRGTPVSGLPADVEQAVLVG